MLKTGRIIFWFALSSPIYAEIITDGTLGPRVELAAPDYQVTQDLGKTVGPNLFHSFEQFNLSSGETATFSGSPEIQNVISRVTGGNPSNIDGTLRSTIPNADVYFLNPYGIFFGPNAKLDVQGGFHASTADYLRLQDGGRFEARMPGNSVLTVAPVAAFGFLTDTPATITTQDTTLMVPPFKPLSLIGGHLHLQGSLPIQFDDQNIYAKFATSLLKTTGGPLYLAAVGSAGEVQVDNPDFTLTSQGGEIRLDRTLVDTSGPGSGNLKIRGGKLFMSDSTLQANTLGDIDGGLMDIQLTESLHADSEPYYFIAFANVALGRGQGGPITIKVPELTLNRAHLHVTTLTEANAGNIDLDLTRLTLQAGAGITANSLIGRGKGGQITIQATESVLIAGHSVGSRPYGGILLTDYSSLIDSTNYSTAADSLGAGNIYLTTQRLDMVSSEISNTSFGTGNAGNVVIRADNVNITKGSFICACSAMTGAAGNTRLDVTGTLFLSGRRDDTYVSPIIDQRLENIQSSINNNSRLGIGGQLDLTAKTIHLTEDAFISASSFGLGEKASNINLQAETLLLTAGGSVNSSNILYAGTIFYSGAGSGMGGDIRIQAKHLTLDGTHQRSQTTGIFSNTYNQGQGGNLFVQTDSLDISHNAALAARSYNTGNAGQINLQTQHLHLSQHGSISTSATQAGGGNIILNGLSGLLYLDNSEITTSVASGTGDSGNITVEKPQFVVMNHGNIIAQADAGNGGNIRIVAERFIATPDSLVSASSRWGIDGEVMIDSPNETISDSFLDLPVDFIEIGNLLPRPCRKISFEEYLPHSTFTITPLTCMKRQPNLQTCIPLLLTPQKLTLSASGSVPKVMMIK